MFENHNFSFKVPSSICLRVKFNIPVAAMGVLQHSTVYPDVLRASLGVRLYRAWSPLRDIKGGHAGSTGSRDPWRPGARHHRWLINKRRVAMPGQSAPTAFDIQ
ncbi:hypothetical protein CBL_05266 [Carabus blaptoides fortunei]